MNQAAIAGARKKSQPLGLASLCLTAACLALSERYGALARHVRMDYGVVYGSAMLVSRAEARRLRSMLRGLRFKRALAVCAAVVAAMCTVVAALPLLLQ